ncbi:spore gernimation protein [Bacillus methanolicus]|uniref:GerAB/ArcD/ProY family transporter n=1 Tax=Bacillus methanolicus TaxID=1471 RepID=UPI0020107863|nr:GerAB/ArcD/ProY family transporter [Bacillus methanolicus]UQD51839.1 spore gernimation protein [Bacillus methanolicus]
MIWGILAIGFLSQIILIMLSKWLASNFSAKGYEGFVQLFGESMVRFFAFAGLFFILIKITVITLGYAEMVHQIIYPSMNPTWMIVFIFLVSCYVAIQGMGNTIRFFVIAFLCSFWMIFLFLPFFFPPIASLYDLYPLIPTEWSMFSWKGLLLLLSSLSGPEYLICLAPWLKSQQKMLKYLTAANAFSVFEYLIAFIASLLFFGPKYLSKSNFPVISMIRYLQFPFIERIDIFLISVYMLHFVVVISILVLFFYGAARIVLRRFHEQTTRIGFMASFITVFAFIILANEWLWKTEEKRSILLDLQIWLGSLTYLLVPAFVLIAGKVKGRV